MKDWSTYELETDDYRYLLQRQREEYQRIREKASRTIQMILAVISLTVSFGIFQYLASRGITPAFWDISFELANRCAPDSLTHNGVILQGVGKSNSLIGFVLLCLALYLMIEILVANYRIQTLPQLTPNSELEILRSGYRSALYLNIGNIQKASSLWSGIKYRLWYSAGLTILAGVIFGLVFASRIPEVLFVDVVFLLTALLLILKWLWNYWAGLESDHLLKRDTKTPSLVFISGLSILWLWSFIFCYNVYLLLDYLIIC